MVLKYLIEDAGSRRAEVTEPQKPSSRMQTTRMKNRRRHLFCLLLLANIIVLNAVHGLYAAEKDTPMWEAVATDNIICKLWKKYPLISKSPQKGMIIGILFNEANPAALIDDELVHEGDTIDGVKVVQINRRQIQFEKNGKTWVQGVREKPRSAW